MRFTGFLTDLKNLHFAWNGSRFSSCSAKPKGNFRGFLFPIKNFYILSTRDRIAPLEQRTNLRHNHHNEIAMLFAQLNTVCYKRLTIVIEREPKLSEHANSWQECWCWISNNPASLNCNCSPNVTPWYRYNITHFWSNQHRIYKCECVDLTDSTSVDPWILKTNINQPVLSLNAQREANNQRPSSSRIEEWVNGRIQPCRHLAPEDE